MASNEERVNFLPYSDKWCTIRNILYSALNLEHRQRTPIQDFESKQAVWEILHAKDDTEFSDINRRYSTSTIMTMIYGQLVPFAAGALIEAGSDVTTTALNNAILACLLYLEVVAAAHEELGRAVGSDRMPDFSDEPRLPYIRGIAKETLRWRPSTKIGTCHSTTQDDWYKGYFIPKGAVVVLNWWAIHMDEGRWKDPQRFDPSRYLDDPLTEAESMAQADANLRDHLTFGAGCRNCPGVHISRRSLFINTARLFWAFNIQKSVDENGDSIEPSTAAQPGFLLTPIRFPCKLEARSEKHAALIEQTWSDAQKQGLAWWKEKAKV